MKRARAAVIGGGISGLVAALRLSEQCEVTLYERDTRLGGKIRTANVLGSTLEAGPDSFLVRKPWMHELALELGLEAELVSQNPDAKGVFLLSGGELQPLPRGVVMGVPGDFGALLDSPLVSWKGKARAGLDLLLPPDGPEGDEAIGALIRRRLGREIAQTLAEPLLAGIYAGSADAISVLSTFPGLREMERVHGSLLLGAKAHLKRAASQPVAGQPTGFQTIRGGLERIVDVLERELQRRNVGIKMGAAVSVLRRETAGWQVILEGGQTESVDGVVIAIPASAATGLISGAAPELSGLLQQATYASVATAGFLYKKDAISRDLLGTGFLVPRREGLKVTACTFSSVKWPGSARDDLVALRLYVGRAGETERWAELSDDALLDDVESEVQPALGITGTPLWRRLWRWHEAMPQYKPGHLQWVQRVRHLEATLPGFALAGPDFEGVGLPDCVRQARDAGQRAMR